jgi:hypothetical protein
MERLSLFAEYDNFDTSYYTLMPTIDYTCKMVPFVKDTVKKKLKAIGKEIADDDKKMSNLLGLI